MTLEQFKTSLQEIQPPISLSTHLQAMWHDGRNDWDKAHDIVQDGNDPMSCRIHAYLHRREGDEFNAGYWYNKAKLAHPRKPVQEEWDEIVQTLLGFN